MQKSAWRHAKWLTGTLIATQAFAATSGKPAGQGPIGEAVKTSPATGEIIVTAQRRKERLQDVPVAVTAITGSQLREDHVADILDLSNRAPGLQIRSADNGANPRIFLRGAGLNDFNPATASAVAIYVDGVYVASPLAQRAAFFDLAQVEVLRGPQGTLFGRNTTGGAINITTAQPADHSDVNLSLDYGRFNAVTVQGAAGGPVAPGLLSVRIAGLYQRDDGYMLNTLTGDHGNNTKRWAIRGSLLFTPAASLTDALSLTLGRSNGGSLQAYARSLIPQTAQATGPDGLCLPAFYTSGQCTNLLGYANTSKDLYRNAYRFDGKDKVHNSTLANTLTWDAGRASVVSVTGYQFADRDDLEETDANPLPVFDAHYVTRQRTVSEELRVQANGHPRLRYVAGLYFAHDTIVNRSSYQVLPGLLPDTPSTPLGTDPSLGIGLYEWPSRQRADSYAAFGQIDYDLVPRLTLTGGLRYSIDRKRFSYLSQGALGAITLFAFDDAATFRSVSGRASAQYRFSGDANIYASYNRGAKSGGFFSGLATDPSQIGPYRDETVDAFELGAKTQWLDRKLTLNAAAFLNDYHDMQVYSIVQNGLLTEQVFTNASGARIYGAELEMVARPARGLELSVAPSYLHAKYRKFVSFGQNYSNNTLTSAPRFSLQASAQYSAPLAASTLVARVEVNHRSKVFFDPSNARRLSDAARTYVDLRTALKLPGGHYEIAGWVKNVFNATNITDITPLPQLGFDLISVGMPRSFGATLSAHY